MPHKHKRKAIDRDESHYELPPTTRATSLPVSNTQNARSAKKRKTAKTIPGYGKDDTPKAFSRLLELKKTGRHRNGLDDGIAPPKKKKGAKPPQKPSKDDEDEEAVTKETDTTTNSETQPPQQLKILPGERLSEFSSRVNQALPLAGLQKTGKKIAGVKDHRVTKHEKKLKRLQAGWRKEEERIRDKEQEEKELAEEERDEYEALWGEEEAAAGVSGKGKKGKKKGRKLVVGEVDSKEEDLWDALQRRGKQKTGLHDVVQAPPEITRVPREIFKVRDGATVSVGNVPNKAGSLRKREELGVERLTIIDTYRRLMEAKRKGE
ncbi:hypothetical protein BU24DRAFT_486093 [Aaosphaeria arxii CBS 175.79]|uniref:Uncharacterized protein n=1 Tax=Aaosphaeria arxii CBS 175.79 TaxID=1450172 RepID=A0A6A5XEA3_9PLEO|nr:uncharacterized protein BU24DRAFT_486093 [Aaosphaeria arxii CBS 175.79]KAF2011378.1 hypothetical protein BU24DRAFT_486093 [Aaosphaeria arxii CBS 175.79]